MVGRKKRKKRGKKKKKERKKRKKRNKERKKEKKRRSEVCSSFSLLVVEELPYNLKKQTTIHERRSLYRSTCCAKIYIYIMLYICVYIYYVVIYVMVDLRRETNSFRVYIYNIYIYCLIDLFLDKYVGHL